MPNLKTYSLSQICGLFDEAIRTIPGYDKYDPTYEPKALINYDKTKDNYALYINPCMLHKKGERNKSQKIINLIQEKTGKTPRKDCVACSLIVTLPRDYEGDPRIFFEASVNAICITCGIKKEDILYAVAHMDESQPHIHLAFLPMSYVRDYDAKLEAYNKQRDEAKANGTKVPARPTILKGEVCRKIEDDEKPISTNCGRFGKGFLHNLNKNLEDRMREQGVEVRIANEAGSKFDPQRLNHQQREESLKLFEENEKLKKEIETAKLEKAQAETKVSAIKSELETTTKQLELTQDELTIAINEKEIAETKVSACEKQVAKATRELAQIKEEVVILQKEKFSLLEQIANLKKMLTLKFKNIFAGLFSKLVRAKNKNEEKFIEEETRDELLLDITTSTTNIEKSIVANMPVLREGVAKSFNKNNPQQWGIAINTLKRVANTNEYASTFGDFVNYEKFNAENNPIFKFCLDEWFDANKHQYIWETIPEEEFVEYKKPEARAKRTLDFAKECLEKGLIDIEVEKEYGD